MWGGGGGVYLITQHLFIVVLYVFIQRNKEGICSVAFSTFEAADACLPV